jgi:hypothetical protein
MLEVIVGHPTVMRRSQVIPRRRLGKRRVSHSALHIEGGLDIGLPGLPFGNLLFDNPTAESVAEFGRLLERSREA